MTGAAFARFVIRRGLAMVGVLICLAGVMFVIQHYTPADPVRVSLGANARPEIVAAERHRLGYDRPLPVQFVSYLGDLARGDLGSSLRTHRTVAFDLGEFLPASLELVGAALLIAAPIALLLAIAAARGGWFSRVVRLALLAGASAPIFLLGLLALIVFYQRLKWLPANGQTSLATPDGPTPFLTVNALVHGDPALFWDALKHLLLPALCLAIAPAVAVGRVMASSVTSNMETDYVKTARSKGLSERRILFGHVLRNCLNGALAMTGLQLGLMLAGLVVIEQLFAWPGIGSYLSQAVENSDFPAVLGVTLVLGAIYVVANAVVDVLQAVADPRIEL
jgi:peptide/nickel transport system permease protein